MHHQLCMPQINKCLLIFSLLSGYFHCTHCSWDNPESLPDRICLSKTVNNLAILCTHSHKVWYYVCLLTVSQFWYCLYLEEKNLLRVILHVEEAQPCKASPPPWPRPRGSPPMREENGGSSTNESRAGPMGWGKSRAMRPGGNKGDREWEWGRGKGVVEWLKCGLPQVFVQRSLA